MLGAGLLGDRRGRLVVVRAPEDVIPEIASARRQVAVRVVGRPAPDQGLFARGSRCGIGQAGACEVVATLRNGDRVPRVDRYAAYLDGTLALDLKAAVPAHGTTTVTLTARPGSSVRLQLRGRDALALDDVAWFTVPSAADTPPSMTVTLVGDPATAKPLAQALAAAPGVNLELRTRATYRRSDALRSDLVVLDGWVPPTGLPPAPAVALIAPPRLPGGAVGGPLGAAPVSSTAVGHDLIRGVDLRSLSVDRDAARRLTLPGWLEAVVSSPGGPLLAAGDNGRRRLAVLAFDPPDSNLTQLSAFPILARNLERWAAGWTSAGDDGSLTIDSLPGRNPRHDHPRRRRSTHQRPARARPRHHGTRPRLVHRRGDGPCRRAPGSARGEPAAARHELRASGRSDRRHCVGPHCRATPRERAELVSDRAGADRHRRRVGLLALAPVAAVSARELGRRVTVAGVAAVLAALAAVGALADLHTGSRAPRAVLAVDRSASIDAAMRRVESRWIGRADPDGCVAPCRIVGFGARAEALPPGGVDSSIRGATNLEAGVAAAVAAAPRGGRVVLLSDGEQTTGDASAGGRCRSRARCQDRRGPARRAATCPTRRSSGSTRRPPCTRGTRSRCS